MTDKSYEDQGQAISQAVFQAGLSGTLYLDVDPDKGFFRAKLVVTPEEYTEQLTSGLSRMLEQAAYMMKLRVKTHIRRDEEVVR